MFVYHTKIYRLSTTTAQSLICHESFSQTEPTRRAITNRRSDRLGYDVLTSPDKLMSKVLNSSGSMRENYNKTYMRKNKPDKRKTLNIHFIWLRLYAIIIKVTLSQ